MSNEEPVSSVNPLAQRVYYRARVAVGTNAPSRTGSHSTQTCPLSLSLTFVTFAPRITVRRRR